MAYLLLAGHEETLDLPNLSFDGTDFFSAFFFSRKVSVYVNSLTLKILAKPQFAARHLSQI